MKKLYQKIFLLSFLAISLTAVNVQAAMIDISNPITVTDFNELVEGILDWVLGIAGSVALLMLIAGGIMYATAAGSEEKTKAAKKTIFCAILGVIIVILSYSMIVVLHGILT